MARTSLISVCLAQDPVRGVDEHSTTAPTVYREMDMRFWLEKAEGEIAELR